MKKRTLILVLSLISYFSVIAQNTFLLGTKWDQGTPFNYMCPVINGTHTVTGCGATALAQILNFYKQPAHGYEEITYKAANIEDSIKVNFNDLYFDWAYTEFSIIPNLANNTLKINLHIIFNSE